MPMELLGCCAEIGEVAQHRGVLKEGTEQLGAVDLLEIAYYQLKAKTRCAGFKDVDGLGEARGIHVEFVGSAILAHPLGKSHAFGRRSCFVKQRGVCQLHAGEIQDHLLVVQQTFKSALGYLWLVGCVGGIPTRILQQISQNDIGCQCVVIAQSDEGAAVAVFAGKLFKRSKRALLIHRSWQVEWLSSAIAAGRFFQPAFPESRGPTHGAYYQCLRRLDRCGAR